MHKKSIIHRDLKGANILVSNKGQVQIADFGLARQIQPLNENLNYTLRVVTLWFRSPELLLGMRNYSFSVDCWSLGCIFAELILAAGEPLFKGNKENE